MWDLLIVLAVLTTLIAIFVWSRHRSRETRRLSQRHMREKNEILLYSTGEGLMGLGGIIFLASAPAAFKENIWAGMFFALAGLVAISIWARYALCGRSKPCLILNETGIESALYGKIAWSDVEKVSRVKFTARLIEFDFLVVELSDIDTARKSFIVPLRWLHRLNRSREVKFKLANMSLSGNDVFRYAKGSIA